MTDPIQAASSIPLPLYQTVQGTLDPLPITSPRELDKSLEKRSDSSETEIKDGFEDYLDQKGILNLEEQKKSLEFDPVSEIQSKSIYQTPGKLAPP